MLVLNTHTEQLLKTMGAVHTLHSLLQVDYAHTQLVSMLMSDMLRDNSSSVDSLAMGIITPYLVPLSLVQDILTAATRDSVTPLQAHLAYTLGSAVSIHVDPEATDLALIINLPIVTPENIYRLKDVVNVGSWQNDTLKSMLLRWLRTTRATPNYILHQICACVRSPKTFIIWA